MKKVVLIIGALLLFSLISGAAGISVGPKLCEIDADCYENYTCQGGECLLVIDTDPIHCGGYLYNVKREICVINHMGNCPVKYESLKDCEEQNQIVLPKEDIVSICNKEIEEVNITTYQYEELVDNILNKCLFDFALATRNNSVCSLINSDAGWSNFMSRCRNEILKQENNTFTLSNGRKAEIKVMPSTSSERAIEELGELEFNVTLKEVGQGEDARVVYEFIGNKEGKFLGIFKIMARVGAQVDAENGEIVKVIKPWWGFLASGV